LGIGSFVAHITLYTTSACSACEAAFDLLASMPDLRGWSLTTVEIAADDDLLKRFGNRVPVLTVDGGEGAREIDWPFAINDVRQLLT